MKDGKFSFDWVNFIIGFGISSLNTDKLSNRSARRSERMAA